eukprot:3941358-Rhodomonas_salina.1
MLLRYLVLAYAAMLCGTDGSYGATVLSAYAATLSAYAAMLCGTDARYAAMLSGTESSYAAMLCSTDSNVWCYGSVRSDTRARLCSYTTSYATSYAIFLPYLPTLSPMLPPYPISYAIFLSYLPMLSPMLSVYAICLCDLPTLSAYAICLCDRRLQSKQSAQITWGSYTAVTKLPYCSSIG